jgi:hypothetical protein
VGANHAVDNVAAQGSNNESGQKNQLHSSVHGETRSSWLSSQFCLPSFTGNSFAKGA